jgi:hypothetical protein
VASVEIGILRTARASRWVRASNQSSTSRPPRGVASSTS